MSVTALYSFIYIVAALSLSQVFTLLQGYK